MVDALIWVVNSGEALKCVTEKRKEVGGPGGAFSSPDVKCRVKWRPPSSYAGALQLHRREVDVAPPASSRRGS